MGLAGWISTSLWRSTRCSPSAASPGRPNVGLSQPGMSNTLARLRKLFGDPLVREGLTLVPTPRAESLRQPVADALSLTSTPWTTGRDSIPPPTRPRSR